LTTRQLCRANTGWLVHDHVVEMSHDKVRAAELPIKGRGCQHDSSQAGNEELEQEPETKQHGQGVTDFAPSHGAHPVEYLDTDGLSRRLRRQHKEGVTVRLCAYREHVVGP